MSPLTDRQLAMKLRPDSVPEPPAGLLDELRRQIPAEVRAPAPADAGNVLPFRRPLPRRVWLAAASVVMLVGGGTLSWLALHHQVGLETAAAPPRQGNAELDSGSPAESRDGSAGAMQPRDRDALGYVGAPSTAPRVAAPSSAAPPATAPTYPGRFYAREREDMTAGGGAAQQRVSVPAEVPAGVSMGVTARRRADAPRPAAQPSTAQPVEAPPQLREEPNGLTGELELDREAEGARDGAIADGHLMQASPANGRLELTLRDERGVALPGVTVSATGDSAARVAVTDAQGRAAIPALPSGQYRVEAELEGFVTTVYDAVSVAQSRPTQVEAQLKASVEDIITTAAESPLLDRTAAGDRRTSTGSTVSREQLAKIPVTSEAWRIVRSTPGVLAERGGATVEAAVGDAEPASLAEAKARAAAASTTAASRNAVASAPAAAAPARSAPAPAAPVAGAAPAAPPAAAEPAPAATRPPSRALGHAPPARRNVVFKSTGNDPFVDSEENRLSAFTLDVGTSSYDLVRRHLAGGTLPPPATVGVEEIVNAFDYGDAAPASGDFALFAEAAPDPWAPAGRYVLVRFAVKAREARRGVAEPTVALDARVQVEVDPRYVSRWRLLGHEDRGDGGERFRDEGLDATTVRAGAAVSALYELELRPDAPATATLAVLRVRWRPTAGSEPRELHQPLRLNAVASTWERASRGFRLATVVGRFAEVLRGSYWAIGNDFAELQRRLAAVAKEWPRQARVIELVRLVERARD